MDFLCKNNEKKDKANILKFDTKNRLLLGNKYGNEYLTNREMDILKYILQGYTAKKIGASLEISYRTVEFYINTLKLKLHCNSKSDIISTCFKLGLIKILLE